MWLAQQHDRGILGISEEPDGSCRVGFAFIPTVKLLRPDHLDFERLKETLLAAATTRHDVFYTEVAGSEGVLDDVALAPDPVLASSAFGRGNA